MTATTMTKTETVEVALFNLLPDVDTGAFLDASVAIVPAVRQFGGFLRRTLYTSEDGRWVDLVDWASLADAERAAEAALSNPACQPFLTMIDEPNATMLHASPMRRYNSPADGVADHVVELHLARLRQGITEDDLLRAADAIMPDAQTMDGYLGRQVLKAGDGWWIDLIFWRDREAATRAGAVFATLPSATPLIAAIDPVSITMLVLTPVQHFD